MTDGVGMVGIYVRDQAVEFYVGKLGFESQLDLHIVSG